MLATSEDFNSSPCATVDDSRVTRKCISTAAFRMPLGGELQRVRLTSTATARAHAQCLTKAFNPDSEDHKTTKREIELGNGLPGIRTTAEVDKALADAGLEVCTSTCICGAHEPGSRVPRCAPLLPAIRWAPSQCSLV